MDDLDVRGRGGIGHAQARGQGLDGGVRVGEFGVDAVDEAPFLVARGAHAMDVDVDAVEPAHEARELGDVHARAAVDFRGIFSGHHRNSHGRQRIRIHGGWPWAAHAGEGRAGGASRGRIGAAARARPVRVPVRG